MKVTIDNTEARWLIRLADTSVILGQRMAEWCSKGPYLEEDMAMSNIALDLFGRAEELYKIIAELDGNRFAPDDYVFHRNERQYYNLKLVEQPNKDFAWGIARQFLHDVYAQELFSQLASSKNEKVAGLSTKVLKEIEYNLIHSRDWMYRLGLGTQESNSRLQDAIDHLLKYTSEIFDFDDLDQTFIPNCEQLEKSWNSEVNRVLTEINIERKEVPELSMKDFREGFHSEELGEILSVMQYLPRSYPDAKW